MTRQPAELALSRAGRTYVAAGFFGFGFDLAVFGGSPLAYAIDRLTHRPNEARSSLTFGGKTTYSRMGRPGIGSNKWAPGSAIARGRSSSPNRRNISSPKTPKHM